MELFGDEFEICPHCGYIVGTQAEEAIHMEPGTLLHDRYIVGKVLGYGGFGVTYIGWDGKLEQKVAVKEYLPGEFSTRMPGQSQVTVFNGDRNEQFHDGLEKFVEEAKRLAKFQNEPGIVKIFDSFKENDTAYIIMEYLEGETLTSYLKREKTIPEDQAVAMMMPVMESLQAVHAEGMLHRDIAPDNIFLLKNGEVKLIDFGASRYATTSHSRSLTVIIKPGYSPEEQYRSRGDQGTYTDVYAIAGTLYKMITGKTPPDAMERRAKYENQNKDILEAPHKIEKTISLNREIAILNAMNVRIEDRTPDIATFIKELNADPPAKRRYGKIKKIDLYSWPLWVKIAIPSFLAVFIALSTLLMTGVIRFPSLFSDDVVVPEGVVVVPDVEGMDKDEALKLLADSKLLPSPDGNIESAYIEAGKIVLQSPTAGSYLSENGTVVLTVSNGKGVVNAEDGISTVPYVIWDTQENAVAKLKEAGLAEPIIILQSDNHVAAGMVISQDVESGTQLDGDSQITLVVSSGPAAFDMPSVIGLPEADARKLLSSKGLTVTVQYAKNDSVAEGKVISQSVQSGEKITQGEKVALVVSSGKPLISVANVVGAASDTAQSTLKSQGFKVAVLENYDSAVAAGKVISQNPASGTGQVKGSTITIYVSKGKQPVNVLFNAAGGTVTPSSKIVKCGDKYGTLPVPTRAYYTFNGWYTQAAGGERVTEATILSTTTDVTLFARWTQNAVSGWVLESAMPSDAQLINTKWIYTRTQTTESTNSSMSGWTQTGNYWKQTGSGSANYASFPGGFSTSHSIYKNFAKSAYSAYDNGSTKREVSNSWAGYVYWHWMYDCGGANGISNRAIYHKYGYGPYNGFLYKYFYAFTSTKGNYSSDNLYCNSQGITNYIVNDQYTSASQSGGATRWFRFDYYTSRYTDYQKIYQYQKVTDGLESSTSISNGGEISNVQKYVQYRPK